MKKHTEVTCIIDRQTGKTASFYGHYTGWENKPNQAGYYYNIADTDALPHYTDAETAKNVYSIDGDNLPETVDLWKYAELDDKIIACYKRDGVPFPRVRKIGDREYTETKKTEQEKLLEEYRKEQNEWLNSALYHAYKLGNALEFIFEDLQSGNSYIVDNTDANFDFFDTQLTAAADIIKALRAFDDSQFEKWLNKRG